MTTNHARTQPTIAPGTYDIDPSRSRVGFAIKELFGLATVRGTFDVVDGTVHVAGDPLRSSVRASMDANSFSTGSSRRDRDVTGKKFLDAASHPTMSFTSTAVTGDENGWTLTGTLTVHGTTAPVDLRLVESHATTDGCAFTATGVVDRTAFGVGRGAPFIGRELAVTIDIVATRTSGDT